MTRQPDIVETLNELVDAGGRKFAERPFVSFAFNSPVTYQSFRNRVLEIASLLKDSGVKKGDRISILAENSPQWSMVYMGAVRLGAVVVPILPDFPESDVLHILSECKARILFITEKQIEKISELSENSIERVITLDDFSGSGVTVEVQPLSEFTAGFAGGLPGFETVENLPVSSIPPEHPATQKL
jgi:long-chain acyl-CoA synthetase